MTVGLLGMLYSACTNDVVDCNWPYIPTISHVIRQPFYDRIFCILVMFFTMAVFQIDVRAYYSRLDGIATPFCNTSMLYLGMISCITLTLDGYMDEKTYPIIHVINATLFFISMGLYAWLLAAVMNNNLDKFPEEDYPEIATLNKVKWVMLASLLLQLFSFLFADYVAHLAEWAAALLFINFFSILSFTNRYYDTVRPVSVSID